MHRSGLLQLIDQYQRRLPDEAAVADRFRSFMLDNDRCFERDCWAGHITGSAWLVNEAGSHVLLTHHRKLQRWLQLGGHSDGDPDTLAVTIREAEEESGLRVEVVSREMFDLDVHEIPARRSDPAHNHFDVRFALKVCGEEAYVVSGESLALAWVPIAEIESYTREESVLRMVRKWLRRQ